MTKNKHTRQIPIENVIDSTAEIVRADPKKVTEILHVLSGTSHGEALIILQDVQTRLK